MKHEFVQEQGKRVLKLEGDFTIQNVGEIRDALLRALEESENVEISLENVTEMDVSSLQLLCSAHRTFVSNRKSFAIAREIPPIVLQNVSEAGFMRQSSCPLDTGSSCLWVMEKS